MSGSQFPACYEIRIEGILDQRWTAWFEGLQIVSDGQQTIISGLLPDQPATGAGHIVLYMIVTHLSRCSGSLPWNRRCR